MSNLFKNLGPYQGNEILIKNSRFGIVIEWGKKYISLRYEENPMEIAYTRAIELIEENEKNNKVMGYYKDIPYKRGKGRFGIYIKYNGRGWTIPKDKDLDTMSEQEIHQFIQSKLDEKL